MRGKREHILRGRVMWAIDTRQIKNLCQALILVGFANFFVFSVVASRIGGNAGDGMVQAGRYYLGVKSHYTQVGQNIYMYSLWHGYSLLVTHPLIILSAVALSWLEKRHKAEAQGKRD